MTKKILSFKGVQYNPDFVTSYADVVTPPYDVISPEMQDEFYARSPYNFCRIDFPKEEGAVRYEKAGQLYAQWLSEGVLAADAGPAIYVHHQSFTLPDGRKVVRKGFWLRAVSKVLPRAESNHMRKLLMAPRRIASI